VILIAALALDSAAVPAQEAAPTGVAWKCLQQNDADFHVVCVPLPVHGVVAEKARGEAPSSPADSGGAAAAAALEGLDLRAVTERGLDEVFSADAWTMPLYTRPTNPAAVVQLLNSVLCSSAPGCSVSYRFSAPRAQ
jgi:hypothetical protein